MIPNIIHFIYPTWDNVRPLSFMNYMAVKIAAEVHQPDEIKFWVDGDPIENEWWERIKPFVTVCRIDMPKMFEGVPVVAPQYASDVARLQILQREGGIYLDTDMFLLHPLSFWLDKKAFVASYEPRHTSMCNALMMAPKGAEFINVWLERLPEALRSDVWANAGVNLPAELAKQSFADTRILDSDYFCPLDFSQLWLFDTDPLTVRAGESLTRDSFSIHGFETYWRDYVGHVTPEWVLNNDCLFSRKFAKHLLGV